MHSDGCECVVWRQGPLRCELWSSGGRGILKVFEGSVLTRQESFKNGTWYHRAQELRRLAISATIHPMREAIQSADAVLFRPCVLTDAEGVVLDASNNVDRLVNLTRRGLIGRNLFMFFDRDREMVADVAAVATRQPATLATRLRPRDRKPTPVWIRIHAVRGRGANLPRLRWSFE